jgi:acetyl esterase/lipase
MLYPLTIVAVILAVGVAQISGFLLFLYILETVLFLKLTPKTKPKKIKRADDSVPEQVPLKKNMSRRVVAVIGLSLVVVNTLPLICTPFAIIDAETEFAEVYGENWRDKIPNEVESYFLPTQFNLFNYFVGFPQPDCNIDRNIQYLKIDNETYFNFDAYYPKDTNIQLPGNNSMIIKIHGGAWVSGDKSEMHTLWINKYLAAQGYIVFDIQYGLLDVPSIFGTIPTPAHTLGNFTLHDMIDHIGSFTKQIENKLADRYNGNLDSVFFMGGSAGGHLTGVAGLGYTDPYFAGVFSTALTIKGIVPLYPGNDAEGIASGSRESLIPGTPETNPLAFEKFTPSKLADAGDPPALMFQGMQDWMAVPSNSRTIELAMEMAGVDSIVLEFPFASHVNDYITSNNFAQVWLYYLERFLYLEQHY